MATKSSRTRPVISNDNNNNNDKYDWDLIIGVKYEEDNKNMAFFKMNNDQYTKKVIQFVKHAMECNTIILPAVQAIIQDHQIELSDPLFLSTCTCFRFLKYFEQENIVFGVYSAQVLKEATKPCPCFLVPASSSSKQSSLPTFWSTKPHEAVFKQALMSRPFTRDDSCHPNVKACIIIYSHKFIIICIIYFIYK